MSCIEALQERLRADRIEREASASMQTAIDAVVGLQQRIAELEDSMRLAAHRLEIGGDPEIVASGLRLVAGQKSND